MNYFSGRDILIVTKHQKEKVIAPVLTEKLHAKCIVADYIDTDQLGTFTGEIKRVNDILTTLRKKCLTGLESTNYELAIASEGSFYPHPQMWMYSMNEEWLMLMDIKNNLEITCRVVSLNTNHNAAWIEDKESLKAFAKQAGFPEHGLIIRSGEDNYDYQIKGIHEDSILMLEFEKIQQRYGKIYAETDMRAMHNPKRMEVIEKAANKLVEKILSVCPICGIPGFDATDFKAGLPCEECDYPTQSILSEIYICQHCHYKTEKIFPKGKTKEDPQYCDQCNP